MGSSSIALAAHRLLFALTGTLITGSMSVLPAAAGLAESIFQVFAAGGADWIARKEPEHKDAEEEEDDRVNGDHEGEHGDRPASVTRASS